MAGRLDSLAAHLSSGVTASAAVFLSFGFYGVEAFCRNTRSILVRLRCWENVGIVPAQLHPNFVQRYKIYRDETSAYDTSSLILERKIMTINVVI